MEKINKIWYSVKINKVMMRGKNESQFIYRQSDGVIYGMWQSVIIIVLSLIIKLISNKKILNFIKEKNIWLLRKNNLFK